ncbi:hypothetical protein A2U01_0051362, partial [Trifolium medium]|nr:hypothetical protein [Trifolium medium]
ETFQWVRLNRSTYASHTETENRANQQQPDFHVFLLHRLSMPLCLFAAAAVTNNPNAVVIDFGIDGVAVLGGAALSSLQNKSPFPSL